MEKIGEKIKSIRKSKNITQVELARLINKSESTIRKYENGSVVPNFKVMKEIAIALNVSLNDIIPNADFNKSVNMHYFNELSNQEIAQLLKNFNFNYENLCNMEDEIRDFCIEELSKFNPLKLELNSYLKNFEEFKKEDLIDFYNDFMKYRENIISTLLKNEYYPMLNEFGRITNELVSLLDDRNKKIKNLEKIIKLQKEQLNNINSILNIEKNNKEEE